MMPQDNINSTLQNVAVNLSVIAKSDVNAFPPATTTTSVQSTGATVGSDPVVLVDPNLSRHGIAFHNVTSDAASVYIFPTDNAVTTTSLAGSIKVLDEVLAFPSTLYPNVNCGWSAVAISKGGGLPTPVTVFEFF